MKILLDTHAFLWALTGDKRLSKKAVRAYENPNNDFYLSSASYWEMCIKISLGKLKLIDDWQNVIAREMEHERIGWLGISKEHCHTVANLSFHHRDPFDRLLVAQALVENIPIMTGDNQFSSYAVEIVW
jgi:PIN domain nuclease of toxin-antitoxin system